VSVSVKDSGIGIAAEELPHLFGMFYQVDNENVRSHDGLGIGLALARRLTELHGGTIQARSDGIGNGSEFVVALPLANEELTGRQFPPSGVTTNQLLHSEFAKRILVATTVDCRHKVCRS
jgi:K+-sensing histidine kinase KdpD